MQIVFLVASFLFGVFDSFTDNYPSSPLTIPSCFIKK